MERIKLMGAVLIALLTLASCSESQEDLLQPKLYFESNTININAEDVDETQCEFQSRLSNKLEANVEVSYQVGGEEMVKAYNAKYGTKCQLMPAENYTLESNTAAIKAGDIYAESCLVKMKNLMAMEEGETYLIPLTMTGSITTVPTQDECYIVVKKPIVINTVGQFGNAWLDTKLPESAKTFSSCTYEALVYPTTYQTLMTVMGNEGTLIMRFSDLGHDPKELQMAGSVAQMVVPDPTIFHLNTWYHVAFTYDAPSGEAKIYVNGNEVAKKTIGSKTFNLNERFTIGFAYDYQNRQFQGCMSECRLWSVARSAAELREGMLAVDPKTPGLVGYWKLNGKDCEQREDGQYYVIDQTDNHNDAISMRGKRGEPGYSRGSSVPFEYSDIKVKVSN